jgi:hypothetical protein
VECFPVVVALGECESQQLVESEHVGICVLVAVGLAVGIGQHESVAVGIDQ